MPLVAWHYLVLKGTQPWGRMQKFTDYDLLVHFLSSLQWLLFALRPSLLHLGNDFTASFTSSLQIQFDLTQESHLMQTVITFLLCCQLSCASLDRRAAMLDFMHQLFQPDEGESMY